VQGFFTPILFSPLSSKLKNGCVRISTHFSFPTGRTPGGKCYSPPLNYCGVKKGCLVRKNCGVKRSGTEQFLPRMCLGFFCRFIMPGNAAFWFGWGAGVFIPLYIYFFIVDVLRYKKGCFDDLEKLRSERSERSNFVLALLIFWRSQNRC